MWQKARFRQQTWQPELLFRLDVVATCADSGGFLLHLLDCHNDPSVAGRGLTHRIPLKLE